MARLLGDRRSQAGRRSRSGRAARRARSSIASTSSGGATTPAPVSRIRSAAAPSGGTSARIGRSAARYSKTLPERTPLPRPPASGIRSSSASESRCSSSEAWRGAYGISSSRSPSPRSSAHSRSVERKSPRKRAWTSRPRLVERGQERPRVALAEEAARVRDPEAARRACSRARRSRRSRSRSRSSRPSRCGAKPRASSAIASETHVIASAEWATSRATPSSTFSFARTAMLSARRCGCATSESRRSATHLRAGRRLHRGADEVDRVRRRGRDHDVDLLLARDPDRGGDRGQVPAHVLVRDEQPPRGELRAGRARARALPCRAAPRPACGPSGRGSGRGAPRPASASRRSASWWIHFGSSGASTCVSIPSAGQVLRELERPLDAAAARGRQVERDEQQLHARRWYSGS